MGAITFSGFNSIDFNAVLNAVMAQEQQPLVALQTQQNTMKAQKTAFASLATNISALSGSADELVGSTAFADRSVTVSDTTALAVENSANASAGNYEVRINELARSQVTTTTSTHTDKDAIVATGGFLKINDVEVDITGDTSLQGIADAINDTADIGATATIVRANGNYQLVLTGTQTGKANAFTITNNLQNSNDPDNTTVTFASTNAQDATDADANVNGVHVTSDSNVIEGVIGGGSITLLRKTATPVVVTVDRDMSALSDKLKGFVSAFNDLANFISSQKTSAMNGNTSSIGRDSTVRGLRASLAQVLSGDIATGGTITSLAQIGIGFTREGLLKFDQSAFDEAAASNLGDLQKLFAPPTGDGAFKIVGNLLDTYSQSDGIVPGAMSRLDSEMQNLDSRIAAMQTRLDLRRTSLMQEYSAADSMMSSLNAQKSTLSNIGNEYRLF